MCTFTIVDCLWGIPKKLQWSECGEFFSNRVSLKGWNICWTLAVVPERPTWNEIIYPTEIIFSSQAFSSPGCTRWTVSEWRHVTVQCPPDTFGIILPRFIILIHGVHLGFYLFVLMLFRLFVAFMRTFQNLNGAKFPIFHMATTKVCALKSGIC